MSDAKWKFEKTEFDGVYLVNSFYSNDFRGYFLKDFSEEIFKNQKIEYSIKETFYSYSVRGVIRGLHFQRNKQMGKLVRCVKGKIFDVICDLRKESKTFGKYMSFILSEKNQSSLLIPGGFAHGFFAIEDSLISYKCDECFVAEYDDGIVWNDKELGIEWPLFEEEYIVTDKDKHLQTFEEFKNKYGSLI